MINSTHLITNYPPILKTYFSGTYISNIRKVYLTVDNLVMLLPIINKIIYRAVVRSSQLVRPGLTLNTM